MSLRRQVTGALAWAGLVIVIAVPAADLVSSRLLSNDAAPTAAVAQGPEKPTETAPVAAAVKPAAAPVVQPVVQAAASQPEPVASSAPVVAPKAEAPAASSAAAVANAAEPAADDTEPAAPKDPVKDYLAANKGLPSYITAEPSSKPAAAAPQDLTPAAQRLASTLASAPSASAAAKTPAAKSEAAAAMPLPLPPKARPKAQPDRTITEADLKDWKSGTLEDYLKAHGLLSGSSADRGDAN